MHFMYFLGTFRERGNNYNSRNRYKKGYSMYENMRYEYVKVILNCMNELCFYWPDEQEKIAYCNKYGKNIVRLIV